MKLSEKLHSQEVLVLDGAMGTELMRRGLELPLPIWSADANLTHPELVKAIHRDYHSAGADILTTNTFRTTPRSYQKAGYSPKRAKKRAWESLMTAVELARSVAKSERLIAGSIAPLEDCYSPELFPGSDQARDEFGQLSEWYQEAGVDLLLIETMGSLDEIRAVLAATNKIGIPRWVSFILRDGKHLLGGNSSVETVAFVESANVDVLLLNCNSLDLTKRGIETLGAHWKKPWGVYPNLGVSAPEPDGRMQTLVSMETFKQQISTFLLSGAGIVGACCGSTPDHIRLLRETVDA